MSTRRLDSRLARAEQIVRQAETRVGPDTFVLRCGYGPVKTVTNWKGRREFSFGYDASSPLLGVFELDGEPHVMPEDEAHGFLDAEFQRRGWKPFLIVVQSADNWQGT